MPDGGPARGVERVSRHRNKLRRTGAKRVEVVVRGEDAHLIREVAAALRREGPEAKRLRAMLQELTRRPRARTGAELLAFFRASPLIAEDIQTERDRSPGRLVDLT